MNNSEKEGLEYISYQLRHIAAEMTHTHKAISDWQERCAKNKEEAQVDNGWVNEFRNFYDKNDQGGKGRWLVAPWVVRKFIGKLLKREFPMGVSQWHEHGKRFGYWEFFEKETKGKAFCANPNCDGNFPIVQGGHMHPGSTT